MPNRKVHVAVGAFGAAGVAWLLTQGMTPARRFAVMSAASIAGAFAGTLPDLLEPANSPHHRRFFHSVTAGTAVTGFTLTRARELAKYCRSCGDAELAAQQGGLGGGGEVKEWTAWDLALGVLVGVIAGYLSHLALDSNTPKSLPLL